MVQHSRYVQSLPSGIEEKFIKLVCREQEQFEFKISTADVNVFKGRLKS